MRAYILLLTLLLLTGTSAISLPAVQAHLLLPEPKVCRADVCAGEGPRCEADAPPTSCGVPDPCGAAPCGVPGPCDLAPCEAPSLQRIRALPGARACDGVAGAFSIPLNTGALGNNSLLGKNGVDPTWRVALPTPGPALGRGMPPNIPSSWVTSTDASWIGATLGLSAPSGDTTYIANFVVPANAFFVTVYGRFSADNEGTLRDVGPGGASATESTITGSAFTTWKPFAFGSLLPGTHALTADVHNFGGSSGTTATGLIVEAMLHGYCKPKGPIVGIDACAGASATFSYPLDTGFDLAGNAVAAGQPDGRWRLVAQSGGGPGPAFAHGPQPVSSWWNSGTSSWINHNATSTLGGQGNYTYEVTFWVPPGTTTTIAGSFAADNEGFLTVDDLVMRTSWPLGSTPPTGFQGPTTIPTTSLGPGFHILRGEVKNHHTYTGLNVVAQVEGTCPPQAVETEGSPADPT